MPDLIAAYPEAKVVVAERNADSWYKSCQSTIMRAGGLSYLPLVFLDRSLFTKFIGMLGTITPGVFGPKGLEDPENAKKVYHELHEEVRRLVPKERLLEFQLGDGWGPLCEFLGKEAPDKPFPHANDTNLFVDRAAVIRKMGYKRVGRMLLPWLVGATAVGTSIWFRYGASLRR